MKKASIKFIPKLNKSSRHVSQVNAVELKIQKQNSKATYVLLMASMPPQRS